MSGPPPLPRDSEKIVRRLLVCLAVAIVLLMLALLVLWRPRIGAMADAEAFGDRNVEEPGQSDPGSGDSDAETIGDADTAFEDGSSDQPSENVEPVADADDVATNAAPVSTESDHPPPVAPPREEADELPEAGQTNENISSKGFIFLEANSRPPAANVFSGRTPNRRRELVSAGGGNAKSEQAVERALVWLRDHQNPDGSWCFDHTTKPCMGRCSNPGSLRAARNGATGLAIMAFLGAGNTHLAGEHSATVAKALAYLRESIGDAPEGGTLVDRGNMYSHGIATIALSEAFAMTKDPGLRAPAQMCLNYIMYAQDPVGGGWRYASQQAGDTSVVGWQVMALKSGSLAYLDVEPSTFAKASAFLDSVQSDGGASYGYQSPSPRPALTAVGLLCRRYIGWPSRQPALRRGAQQLADWGPLPDDMYYNYYATQFMFQQSGGRGRQWKRWNAKMRDALIDAQEREGHAAGSWFARTAWSQQGGRHYCTCLATLILEVYYRHMPLFQESATVGEPVE